VVTIHLKADKLDSTGFVKDYRALSIVKEYIDKNLDHRHLNDILSENPTAENIAFYLFSIFKESIPELYAVEVSETPKTSAIYESGC
jgi:6-pyruvoyltetrahydropterin/6-carboxytetrahydropterin synthase